MCGHCSPEVCVDHSFQSSFSSISVLSLPRKPLPAVEPSSSVEESECLQGLAWPPRLVTEAASGNHGIGCCWTFKTKAVVKISFLLLFLQDTFFFFANTMFLSFFPVYIIVFSSALTFLCKHIHAHTLAFMNLRSSASNSPREDVGVRGLRIAVSSRPGLSRAHPHLRLLEHLRPHRLQVYHSPHLAALGLPHVQAERLQMPTSNKACEPRPQVFKSRFHSTPH